MDVDAIHTENYEWSVYCPRSILRSCRLFFYADFGSDCIVLQQYLDDLEMLWRRRRDHFHKTSFREKIKNSKYDHDTDIQDTTWYTTQGERVVCKQMWFFQNRDLRRFSDLFYYSCPLSFWPLTSIHLFFFWRFILHIFYIWFNKHRLISFSVSAIHESFRVSFLRVRTLSVSVSLFLFCRLVFDGFSYNFVVSSSRMNYWMSFIFL